jgi:hypothetical protein
MMDVNPDKLALLSDVELRTLADRMGLNLPEGLDRLFMLEEIVEAMDDESQERRFAHDAPGHVEEKKFSGAYQASLGPDSELPLSRYHETCIRAMPRDPSWVFAYWDLSEAQRSAAAPEEGDSELFLRVSEYSRTSDSRREYFDIPVSRDDFRWYINVPHPGARYRIDLCMHSTPRVKVLARSEELHLPLQYIQEKADHLGQSTRNLLLLSGCEELNLAPPERSNPNRIMPDGE